MSSTPFDLDAITIQSPCTVPWASMTGDDVKRYCGQCRLHVHDVSKMSRREVETLVRSTGGRCCLRLWRRPDGRVITRDCSRARLALERRLRALRTAAAALLAFLGLGGCRGAKVGDGGDSAPGVHREPVRTTGVIALPPSPPPPPPPPAEKPPVPGATVTTGR